MQLVQQILPNVTTSENSRKDPFGFQASRDMDVSGRMLQGGAKPSDVAERYDARKGDIELPMDPPVVSRLNGALAGVPRR
jgi:hypothetical protein